MKVTANNTTTQDFLLEKLSGNLTGTVTDVDDGAPITPVIISHEDGRGALYSVISTYMDYSGRCTHNGLPVGTLTLSVSAIMGHPSTNITVTVVAIQVTLEVKAGTYTMEASLEGCKTVSQSVIIEKGSIEEHRATLPKKSAEGVAERDSSPGCPACRALARRRQRCPSLPRSLRWPICRATPAPSPGRPRDSTACSCPSAPA
ncbi:MAG: carboxypeptidase-like regulatory domain-containing protein [Thermoplasmatota archaeon]